VQRVAARAHDRQAAVEELERANGLGPVVLDVGGELEQLSLVQLLLGESQRVASEPGVVLGQIEVLVARVDPGTRPEESGARRAIREVRDVVEHVGQHLARAPGVTGVGEGVREQDREPDPLDQILVLVRRVEVAAEGRDGRLEIAAQRVGPTQRVGGGRLLRRSEVPSRDEGLEPLDRLGGPAGPERSQPQPQRGPLTRRVRPLAGAQRLVDLDRAVRIAEPHLQLGVDQVQVRPARGSVGQIVHVDLEAVGELAQDLERGNPLSGLDARDVRGRAALEGQLALTQPRSLARRAHASADSCGIIDVGAWPLRHDRE
jgi:hypothetical protein